MTVFIFFFIFFCGIKREVRGILMEAVGRHEQQKQPNPYDQKKAGLWRRRLDILRLSMT